MAGGGWPGIPQSAQLDPSPQNHRAPEESEPHPQGTEHPLQGQGHLGMTLGAAKHGQTQLGSETIPSAMFILVIN